MSPGASATRGLARCDEPVGRSACVGDCSVRRGDFAAAERPTLPDPAPYASLGIEDGETSFEFIQPVAGGKDEDVPGHNAVCGGTPLHATRIADQLDVRHQRSELHDGIGVPGAAGDQHRLPIRPRLSAPDQRPTDEASCNAGDVASHAALVHWQSVGIGEQKPRR